MLAYLSRRDRVLVGVAAGLWVLDVVLSSVAIMLLAAP